MSGEHFAGLLTLLTCRGSKGQMPMASLGTAQRLAPVHSGLPLCETCLSSAATAKTSSMILPAASSRIKSGWWWWFCGVGKDCGGNPDYSPLQSIPAFWNRLFTHHSGAKYRTILCRIRHTILFWHSSPHFLLHCFYSTFFFLLQSIKIAVITIF